MELQELTPKLEHGLTTAPSCHQMSKVTVLGAAGGIGQPLSLLLKLNPRVTELALYDIRLAPGSSTPSIETPMTI